MSNRYHYLNRQREVAGPLEWKIIQGLHDEGLLTDDMVCLEGSDQWRPFSEAASAETRPANPPLVQQQARAPQRVAVVDLEMPFGSMVTFMVKWAIASIPAFIILFLIGAGLVMILLAVMGASRL